MNKKILIIDDEPQVVKVLSEYLRDESYEVDSASDGLEGLAKTKEFLPDLILLDMVLPKLDGISVLKKLRENPETKDLPVITLSNLEDKQSIGDAISAGSTEYLIKVQYTPDELVKKVKSVLK